MPRKRDKYQLNTETLLLEEPEAKPRRPFLRIMVVLILASALAALYIYIYPSVFGPDLPKTAILRRSNTRWAAKVEVLRSEQKRLGEALEGLKGRDEHLYRAIFGLGSIPDEVRSSGLGGRGRYADLEGVDKSSILMQTAIGMDILTKKAYVQSKSYDEIDVIAKKAGDLASSIPAITPMAPGTYRYTSTFGYRSDPLVGGARLHSGVDFACPPGNPIYASGSGRISSVRHEFTGYGNSVMIDHGFGYETRYAHMREIYVIEGMPVRRGDLIGTSGNSGRVTGPHLHYEVYYKGTAVNPANYMDLNIDTEEYTALTTARSGDSEARLGNERVKIK